MAIAPLTLASPAPSQTFGERVAAILQSRFSNAHLEWYSASALPLSGNLFWDGFAGVSFEARQRMIWEALETHLTEDEMEDILGFYAFTPFENTFIEQSN